jgi:hypothetical protein
MKKTFKPNIFDLQMVILMTIFLIAIWYFDFNIVPKILTLNLELATLGDIPSKDLHFYLLIAWVNLLPLIFFGWWFWRAARQRVELDRGLLVHTAPAGLSSATHIIPLQDVTRVTETKKSSLFFSGKSVMTIVTHYFVFHAKGNQTYRFNTNGWDQATLRAIIQEIRQKHPNILWKTSAFADTHERWSLLDQYLNH